MSHSIDLSDKLVRGIFEESYEYILKRGYSFDKLWREYDAVKNSERLPASYTPLLKDRDPILVRECILHSLEKNFDDKEYDEKIRKEISDYKKDFQYYPDPKEPDYVSQLSRKQEMALTYVPNEMKTIEEKCNRDFFELAPHQIFLKNLISRNTPYNGVLIFHGVGVGKTCSAITIAENFKDTYKQKDKRIIILASQNIQIGWRKTIYDPQKGDNQCTSDTYELPEQSTDKPVHSIENETKKAIRSYYELHGYAAFANSVKRMLNKNLQRIPKEDTEARLARTKELIDFQYSGRVLIIDEVHNIRTGSDKDVRDTIDYIELVIKHSRDLKLILLTANPMFNQSDEIVWILNMLLINDGRPTINGQDIFEDHILREGGYEIIEQKCRGYVSYLRGENPVSFPVRLYPDHGQLMKRISEEDPEDTLIPPEIDIFGTEIDDEFKLSFLTLYSSTLKGFQKEVYESQMKEYSGKANNPSESDRASITSDHEHDVSDRRITGRCPRYL